MYTYSRYNKITLCAVAHTTNFYVNPYFIVMAFLIQCLSAESKKKIKLEKF